MLIFIARLIKRFQDHDIYALACQLTYNLILSIFPFLIFLLTIIGYSRVNADTVLVAMQSIMPKEAFTLTQNIINEVLRGGRVDILSFSVIGTIWTASSGFRAVIKGLNKAYETQEDRPYIKTVILSFICVIALVIILVFVFSVVVFGEMIGNGLVKYLHFSINFKINWNIIRYPMALVFMVAIFSILYYVVPCRKMRVLEVLPGAIFTSIGWVISSQVISYYVTNINNYTRIYGGLGVVIVLLLWLFITSTIILIGGEINALLVERDV